MFNNSCFEFTDNGRLGKPHGSREFTDCERLKRPRHIKRGLQVIKLADVWSSNSKQMQIERALVGELDIRGKWWHWWRIVLGALMGE